MNRQESTAPQRQPTLTDYIGCLTRVGDEQKFGSAGQNQKILRKMDIENLDGDVIELTMWDEMAKSFPKAAFDSMEKPVIIAVSSCKVSEYARNLQLSATPATHWYLNPDIPELAQLRDEFTIKYDLKPLLDICKTRYKDPNRERTRNRFPLSTLLQENPDSYKAVRFTTEATVTKINTARDWYYVSCSKCMNMLIDGNDIPECVNHGPEPDPTYRYIFKAYITDQTATAAFTFFTPNADVLTGSECSELVKKYKMPRPSDFPEEILAIEGQHHIFQFHYNPTCKTGKVDFYFDDILDKPLQITGAGETKALTKDSAGTSTSESVSPLIPGTPAMATLGQMPVLPSPPTVVKPITTTPSQQLIGLSTPSKAGTTFSPPKISIAETDTEREQIQEPHAITVDRAKTVKRTLFSAEPQEQKRNKSDKHATDVDHLN